MKLIAKLVAEAPSASEAGKPRASAGRRGFRADQYGGGYAFRAMDCDGKNRYPFDAGFARCANSILDAAGRDREAHFMHDCDPCGPVSCAFTLSPIKSVPHIEQVDPCWRRHKKECVAVIETPKGRRNKLSYDVETELFRLDFILPKGMTFPYDFGFIPSTLAPDGDPLDVLVLMEEPAAVGCCVPVRVVGIIEAEQREGKKRFTNDRILAVAVHSMEHSGIRALRDVDTKMLDQLEEFFINYNRARGRGFRVKNVHGTSRAAQIIDKGIRTYEKKHKAT